MHKLPIRIAVLLTGLSLIVAACGGAPAPVTEPPHTEEPHHIDAPPQTGAPTETTEVVFEPGAWQDIALVDVRTGTTFKLSDYRPSFVILEMMDPGCPICSVQVKEIAAAREALGDDVVIISMDVIGKGEAAQVSWADKYGATWAIAQMPREFGASLISDFGSKIIYPGDTPVIIIDPSGAPHVTDPGIKKAATLVDLVNQWTQ